MRLRIGGIVKLEDANNAGSRNAKRCTLILTEGDSAKALAVSGLSVVGRDDFGVFPLRGKLLNVREAAHDQIVKNVEIQHIKQILGLKHGQDYKSTDSLRYGHLMIMTDQASLIDVPHSVMLIIFSGSRRFSHQRFDYQLPRPLLSLAATHSRISGGVHHTHRQGLEGQARDQLLYHATIRRVEVFE